MAGILLRPGQTGHPLGSPAEICQDATAVEEQLHCPSPLWG